MTYLVFLVFRICANGYFITNQMYRSWTFTKKTSRLKCYQSFLVFQLFQHFNRNIIDIFSYIIDIYNQFKDFSKIQQFFNKVCYTSHINAGIIRILKKMKKLFQRSIFCKWSTYVTLICNHKPANSLCSRYYKN